MASIPHWFPWRLEWDANKGKFAKLPCTLDGARWPVDAASPANWHTFDAVRDAVISLDTPGAAVRYTMGFRLTREAGYVLFDLDHALGQDNQWQPIVNELCAQFAGAMIEVSSSGHGLHIIARTSSAMPEHRCKPSRDVAASTAPVELELYSEGQSIAFGFGDQVQGCADTCFDFAPLVECYFKRDALPLPMSPERGHAVGFNGTDDELIRKALSAPVSAAVAFGGKASVADLWNGKCAADSHADAALVAHLAFWCGPDPERIERLMRRSNLIRPKWNERRPGGSYLTHTIAEILAKTDTFYTERPTTAEDAAASVTSDLANAHRLNAAHGQDLMHVPGIGWHVWSGGPWRHDDDQARRLAFGLGRIIQEEADALSSWVEDSTVAGSDEAKRRADFQKTLRRWARSSEFVVSVRHTMEAAQTMLAIKADQLDADPMLVGTPSGVIDLATGQQRPHAREDRITKQITVDYDPSATAPTWARFIDRIMGSDAQLKAYLQTICGYMLSGVRGEHALPVLYGSGANGKSTFLATLQTLLGDYAGTASPGLLLARKDSDQLAAIASLRGLRLVVASESGETERLDESRVKQITGGDRLTGRPLYQNFVEFTPTHLVVLQTNHRPRVTGTDGGIWRRLKLVPFAVTIPETERDAELTAKLRAELPGILAWCVAGWNMYRRHGFQEPDAVRAATAEYRNASDVIGQFIADRCRVGQQFSVSSSALYNFYRLWCAENGEHVLTNKAFSLRVAERPGLVRVRQSAGMTWQGLDIAAHAVLGDASGKVVPMPHRG
ncbi:phage/plasmid primase, P4 family [Luteimonas changyuni]|uniref:phage/plasmid primase, P4 family n=1 Tax=Luteimonas sp. MJ145 TaxID=3129234 RepID=UPI0031BAFAE1